MWGRSVSSVRTGGGRNDLEVIYLIFYSLIGDFIALYFSVKEISLNICRRGHWRGGGGTDPPVSGLS